MSSIPKILIASRNKNKIREISEILEDLSLELITLESFPDLPHTEEDGKTFEENALKKALSAWQATGLATIAEDSGLEVDALKGAPGIMSARFAGPHATYDENNAKLLDLMKAVPPGRRRARFVCVAVLVTRSGKIVLNRGEMEGEIAEEPKGENGFGYDPVFYLPSFGKTVAELDQKTKNAISHRAKAIGGLRDFIMRLE